MGHGGSACSCGSSEPQPRGDDYWLTVGRHVPAEEDPPPDFPDMTRSLSVAAGSSRGLGPAGAAHVPSWREVHRPDWTLENWAALGGEEVEGALESAALTLLSAKWAIRRAEEDGGAPLAPRQALPDDAFLSLSQVQASSTNGYGYVLHIACVSHCWLQAHHPDPFGHNFRVLARCLKLLVQDAAYGGRWAVLFDFCSMHQGCRDSAGIPRSEVYRWLEVERAYEHEAVGRFESEEVMFDNALGHIGTFFSHPATIVLMFSALPPDFTDHAKYAQTTNGKAYTSRGWCYCEASWATLVKEQLLVLDIGKDSGATSWPKLVTGCATVRRAPVLPDTFRSELEHKHFSNSQVDFERVAHLYACAFERRFSTTSTLSYQGSGWDDEDAHALAQLLISGAVPRLDKVDLADNRISDAGAVALAEALVSGAAPGLTSLNLSRNAIGDDGAAALSRALSSGGGKLAHLDLSHNHVGDSGAHALMCEVRRYPAQKKQVWLTHNPISKKEKTALGGPPTPSASRCG